MSFMITGITPLLEHKEYQRVALEQHNLLRARHGGPDMIMSSQLNDLAVRCAEFMVEHERCDHGCYFVTNKSSPWREYFTSPGMGENIYGGKGGYISPNRAAIDAANAFYSEIKDWNFEESKGEAGHFTQMIWRNSDQLGFGVANGPWGVCAIAKYYPPGNLMSMSSLMVRPAYITETAKDSLDKLEKARVKALSTPRKAKSIGPVLLPSFTLTMILSTTMPRKGAILHLIIVLSTVFININPASASGKEYQQVGLDAHNKLRADHGGPPLTLNEKLNEVAEKCAVYYATERHKIDHSCPHREKGMGENLYAGWGKEDPDEAIAKEACQLWYDEIKDYSFANPKSSNFTATGHFTQLVWKSSTDLGMGIAEGMDEDGRKMIVAVAIYTPQGNIQDNKDWKYYKENVVKPVAGSPGAGLVKEESSGGVGGMLKNGMMMLMTSAVALGGGANRLGFGL
ncbi:unnamed protein product [Orchesella dallaii]|uniref:SCP domain-containing protein n=1 Tax=Orchesella dallaii TaxID=48710 RepID=A0ABP1RZ05_9HEXA